MNGAATQIASRQYDDDFFRLPETIRTRVQAKLDDMGSRLRLSPTIGWSDRTNTGCESAITE